MSHQAIPGTHESVLTEKSLFGKFLPQTALNFLLFLFAYSTLIGLGVLCLAGVSYLVGVLL